MELSEEGARKDKNRENYFTNKRFAMLFVEITNREINFYLSLFCWHIFLAVGFQYKIFFILV